MTWHLKDRELEKKLIAIDPDFIEQLQKKEVVGTKAYSIHFGDYVLSGSIGSPRFYAYFDRSELEDVPKYNPNDWNEYPEVKPVEPGIYRLEVKRLAVCQKECYAAVFDFTNKNGWYVYGQGRKIDTNVANDGFVRFRPWDED